MLKKQIRFISAVFLTWLLFLSIQKPLFMAYHHALTAGATWADYGKVILNGWKLDSSVAGYLSAIPLLLSLAGRWYMQPVWRKCLAVYGLAIACLVAVIFSIDLELYTHWQFRLDATALFYLETPADAMASVSFGMFVRQLLIAAVYAAVMYVFWKRAVLPLFPDKTPSGVWPKFGGSLALIAVGGLLFVFIRGGVTTSTSNVGRVYFSPNQFLNHAAINPCFSFFSSLSKSEDFASQFDFYPEEERAKRFEDLFPLPVSGKPVAGLLNTSRPNILIILLESFSANVIGSLGGIPHITPNMNRLSEEGILFTNCYASSFRTDRGTVATLSGYPGLPTTSIMKMPAKSRTLPALAKTLAAEGYEADVLYGGDINFTNMKSYFLGSGYGKLTSDIDFPLTQRLSKWGVQDDITFAYLAGSLAGRGDQAKPWLTMYLTLSTHDPFEVPYHKYEQPYVNTVSYADSCLGVFIDKLKREPVWKDLLIVLIADHGYRYPDEFKEYEPRRYHIPMLWLGGAVKEPCKIGKLVSQTDLPATLLGQMGLPHDEYRFSRDVFSERYTYPFAFYTFNNGFAFIDSTGASVYDNVGERVVYRAPEEGDAARLEKGRAILQTLYDDLGSR